jgi:hypothetical protein
MPTLSQHDNDSPPTRPRRNLVVPAVIVVVVLLFLALHLTGVLGPGSH